MRCSFATTAVLAVLFGSIAEAGPREPTGQWVVDFGESQCVASRNYGTDEKPLLLVLKQPVVGGVMQLGVIRKGGGIAKYADQVDAMISIDDTKPFPASMIKFAVKDRGERVLLMNMPLAQFAAVRKGRALSISAGGEFRGAFQLANIEPLMKVMDECIVGLRELWNTAEGNAAGAKLKESARGNLQGLIRAKDYPGPAIAQLQGGRVKFVVLVNEQGRVADCTVVETSGVASLDAQSCAVVTERARFQPAIGIDGKPAKSTWVQRVTWRIE